MSQVLASCFISLNLYSKTRTQRDGTGSCPESLWPSMSVKCGRRVSSVVSSLGRGSGGDAQREERRLAGWRPHTQARAADGGRTALQSPRGDAPGGTPAASEPFSPERCPRRPRRGGAGGGRPQAFPSPAALPRVYGTFEGPNKTAEDPRRGRGESSLSSAAAVTAAGGSQSQSLGGTMATLGAFATRA